MGWFPSIDVDTLSPNLSDAFWKDIKAHLDSIVDKRIAAKAKYGRDWWMFEKIPGIDSFDSWDENKMSIESIKEQAFLSDHMEHIGSWLWDESLWPIFKLHQINGQFVINHNRGDGGYQGIEFVDGIPHNVNVRVVVERGEKL